MRLFLRRVADVLTRRRGKAIQQPLHEDKRGNPDAERRHALASAIENLGHDDPKVRFNAAEQLEKIGDATAVPALVESLGDEDWDVRKRAAWTLGEIGDASVAAPLIGLLGEGNGEIHIYVSLSLRKIMSRCEKTSAILEFEKSVDDGLAKLAENHPSKDILIEFEGLKNEIELKKSQL